MILTAVCQFTYTDPVSGDTQQIAQGQQIADDTMTTNIVANYVNVADPNNPGSTIQIDNVMRTYVVVSG
jgi:hypothetical protein